MGLVILPEGPGAPGAGLGPAGAYFLANNAILGLRLCEKYPPTHLLATRAASGSNPNPPGADMGWIKTAKDPEPPGAWRGGRWVYFSTEQCDFEDSIGVESVDFTNLGRWNNTAAEIAARPIPRRRTRLYSGPGGIRARLWV